MTASHRDKTRSLDERLASEATFHDSKYSSQSLYPRHYSVRPTVYVYERLKERLGDIAGRDVLEYGCGEGWVTLDLARMDANVSAFDVSAQAVTTTRQLLERHRLLQRCSVEVMPAERLRYRDDSFDVAVGFAIIHHLDLTAALVELHRVLRPGGVAIFAEPLGTNPAIQLYRRFTPQFRTADERPLILNELPQLFTAFSSIEHSEFFLTALASVGLTYLPLGASLYPWTSARLHRFDTALLQRMPSLGRLAWYTILTVTK